MSALAGFIAGVLSALVAWWRLLRRLERGAW